MLPGPGNITGSGLLSTGQNYMLTTLPNTKLSLRVTDLPSMRFCPFQAARDFGENHARICRFPGNFCKDLQIFRDLRTCRNSQDFRKSLREIISVKIV